MLKGKEMKKLKDLSKFKIVLFIVGICGAAYYVTLSVSVLTFILYFGLPSLTIPMLGDLLE